MTVRELYQWAEKRNAIDFPIVVQYRDSGGDYHGGELLGSIASAYYPCLAEARMDSQGFSDINYGNGKPVNAVVV